MWVFNFSGFYIGVCVCVCVCMCLYAVVPTGYLKQGGPPGLTLG